MIFDLQDLACLLAVVDERSFTRAAASLRITQPALSRKIRELENRLGVRLLERTTRKVRLTKAGQLLSRYARTVLETCTEAEQAIIRLSSDSLRPLELGYGSRAQFSQMLQLIARMHDLFPEQRINISHGTMYERLYLGQLDAAVVMEGTIAGKDWADFIRLDDGGLSAFFPRGEFPTERGSLSYSDIRGRRLVIPDKKVFGEHVHAISLHDLVCRALSAQGFSLESVSTAETPEDFCSLVLTEHLVGVVPDSSSVLNNELLDSRPIRECRSGFGIVLAWNRDDSDLAGIRHLREAAEYIAQMV